MRNDIEPTCGQLRDLARSSIYSAKINIDKTEPYLTPKSSSKNPEYKDSHLTHDQQFKNQFLVDRATALVEIFSLVWITR